MRCGPQVADLKKPEGKLVTYHSTGITGLAYLAFTGAAGAPDLSQHTVRAPLRNVTHSVVTVCSVPRLSAD